MTLTFDLLTWMSIGIIYSSRTTYQVWSFRGKAWLSYPLHKVWKTDMTFDLLSWLSIGIIYSSRTIYRPSLKLLGQSVVELSVAQGLRDWHDLWPIDLTINRDHLLIKDYLPTKFEACGAKRCWVIRCTRFGRLTWPLTLTFDLLTWLSIGSSTHQGLSTYQVWSFWGKVFWSYQLHKVKGYRHTDRPTYWHTDRPTDMWNAICPSFFEGGHNNKYLHILQKIPHLEI